ncbi:Gfo/Idh/MocA family protein [Enterovirga aerilata]|uniref:Gfo/Idh/MocA family oxidoreductase n=1 Tax=Enterovirga aerilata TaxID=2730920 RepID=A0A849I4U3_9HYPH|nr:Gfo/Idh/MocA family oxidoreductase [Enterovirga sp. DB1703]NNM72724.1 Gfo/Idh/MocA family oxidoreductase [Enterovirga sp. DB1703]
MRVGVALVGLGAAAQPHARSLLDLEDRAEVRWAATPSPERAAAFARSFPFPVTTDVEAAIGDPAVEAVILLTPPGTHLDLAERCFSAGKHVLLEKPVELTVARGERLVAAGRRAGRRLGVVLQHRFRPGSLRLREIIGAGGLGPIEAAWTLVPWWRPQSYYDEPGRGTMARDGGGVLLTQAIHTLDLFRSLVGVSEVVAAAARTTGLHRMETEDFATALVRLGDGAPGTVTATTAFVPGAPERIEIIGRKASASLVGGALRVQYLDGTAEALEAEGATGSGANIMDFPIDAHRALIAEFLDACREDRDPAIAGEDALASQRLIEEILRAAGFPPGSSERVAEGSRSA